MPPKKLKLSSSLVKKCFDGFPKNNDMMEKILRILAEGGVIAAPTDTVYGLLADATNPNSVAKVFSIKGREGGKALPIFLYSLDWLDEFAEVNPQQKSLLEKVWPGKATAILKLKEKTTLAQNAIGRDSTCAFRVPDHSLVREILGKFGKPLTGTSANMSGQPPCKNAQCVQKQLATMLPDYIIKGGTLPESKPSTIVDLTKTPFVIIRKGADDKKVEQMLSHLLSQRT